MRPVRALAGYARSFTGFERDARIFLLASVAFGTLFSLWWVDFNLYLTALGYEPAFIGLTGAAWSLAGVIVALPLSVASNRLGRRLVMIVGAAVAAVSTAGLIVFTGPAAIIAGSAAVGAASQTFFVLQSPLLMEHSRPEHRNELFSLQAAIMPATNIGAAVLGGVVAAIISSTLGVDQNDTDVYRALLAVMTVAAVLAGVAVVALRDDRPRSRRADAPRVGDASRGRRSRIPRPSDPGMFVRLLIPNFLIALGAGQVIPYLNVFLEGKFGLDLTALNFIFAIAGFGTVLAMMAQPALAVRFGKVGTVVLVQGLSIPFLLVLGFSPIVWTVIAAMTVRTALMNSGHPLANAFAMERLPASERAAYAAAASLLWSLAWAVAGPWYSLLQARLGFDAGYAVNFVTVIVLYSLGTWLYWHWFHGVERAPAAEPRPAFQ
ncbi:MAG: MFS transporter [Candidatus Limnocylindrales bacterium]